MSRVLLDTDILSELLKSRNANVALKATLYLHQYQRFSLTSVTVMEVLYGLLRKGASFQAVAAREFFSDHHEVVPKSEDFRLTAEIMSNLDRRGTPVGPFDPLIAACALNRDLTLATGNTRHYRYIQASGFPLRLEDWRQD